jgi:hypothetical protein
LRNHLTDVLNLCGDLPLKDVFREPTSFFPSSVSADTPVSSIIQRTYRDALYRREPFSVFQPAIERVLWERQRERIHASLALFAAVLDSGGTIMIAPQALSLDGRINHIRSGALQIVQQTRDDPVLLPVNLTYDFMTTGRVRAFLAFGSSLRGVREWNRDRYESEVAHAIAALGTATLGQVAARILVHHAKNGRHEIPEAEFKSRVRSDTLTLADDGIAVDPLLMGSRGFERHWDLFIAYCRRERLLENRDGVLYFDPGFIHEERSEQRPQGHPFVFNANELESLLEASGGTRAKPE